jgi:hypothetical protein
MTDSGEMRTELGLAARFGWPKVTDEVGRYLNLVDLPRTRLRRMTISLRAVASEIFVSYISSAGVEEHLSHHPAAEAGRKAAAARWAIVDNTIGEDWKTQSVADAGSPQSFIQDVSQPLYARRPVIPLPHRPC